MQLSPEARQLTEEARAYSRQGLWPQAMGTLRQLLEEIHYPDSLYDDWVRALATAALEAGRPAVAGTCFEYLLDHARAQSAHQRARRFDAAARCRLRAGDHAGAAQAYESIGAYARAADAWERAGEGARAATAWERAAQRFGAAEDPYRTALALLNLGLVQVAAEDRRGQTTLSRAIVLLEEEADQAESSGRTQRALACYHALIHIGRRTGSHENLAEGFLNCIRLMQSKDHRFFALQYFHDFAETSSAMGQHLAAAEVLREASEFCRRTGMLYADHFLRRAAEAFERAADEHEDTAGPTELAENALLAALDCYNRRGEMNRVRRTYERLARLPLAEARRERYAALAGEAPRGAGAHGGWPFRGYFSEDTAYPATWRKDVTDADAGADSLTPVPESVGNLRLWDVVRRRCLLICLRREDEDARFDDPAFQEELVVELGRVGSPLSLPPLARFREEGRGAVRAAVAAALRFLPFRESIELVGRCLSDADPAVREAALGSLRYLVFPGAFAELIRLYRELPDLQVRREVALALGRLVGMEHTTSKDALDFLLQTFREGVAPELSEPMRTAIAANTTLTNLATLERHILAEPPGEIRSFLERAATRIETRRIAEGWT